jgi:SAM-dependent methyltransferase
MSDGLRVTDYDTVAEGFDRRYALHTYSGVRESLRQFLGSSEVRSILEVGCGTGHWLAAVDERAAMVAGVEPSAPMLARARAAAPRARLVRGRAEALPWADATFDRVFCVNALHHFVDRVGFFAEARRVLTTGGGLLTIGKDPHTERDQWWVYDYFPETLAIDQQRMAPVRILRGEMARAGFAWAESSEADRIEALTPAADALKTGVVDRAYTSQLTVLSDEEFDAGAERICQAAAGGPVDLVTDFRLYATIGWVG